MVDLEKIEGGESLQGSKEVFFFLIRIVAVITRVCHVGLPLKRKERSCLNGWERKRILIKYIWTKPTLPNHELHSRSDDGTSTASLEWQADRWLQMCCCGEVTVRQLHLTKSTNSFTLCYRYDFFPLFYILAASWLVYAFSTASLSFVLIKKTNKYYVIQIVLYNTGGNWACKKSLTGVQGTHCCTERDVLSLLSGLVSGLI